MLIPNCDPRMEERNAEAEVKLTFIQDELREALDININQGLIIESLKDEIIREHLVVDDIDDENEELIADMQDLIQENENLIKELHYTKKAKSQFDAINNHLRSENLYLMDKLEKKRLGWLEEPEVEELKWETKEPLIRKLEASRED